MHSEDPPADSSVPEPTPLEPDVYAPPLDESPAAPPEVPARPHPLALPSQRIGGYLLDYVAYGVAGFALAFGLREVEYGIVIEDLDSQLGLMALVVGITILSVQLVLMGRGQSLGKRAIGTRIHDLQGNVAGFLRVFGLREVLGRQVPALAIAFGAGLEGLAAPLVSAAALGLLLFNLGGLFHSSRRTVHDRIAGTEVLIEPRTLSGDAEDGGPPS